MLEIVPRVNGRYVFGDLGQMFAVAHLLTSAKPIG
jgi:hypothetical protein